MLFASIAWLWLFAAFAFAGPYDIVVVRPGGPSQSEQAQEQIDRLAKELGKKAQWAGMASGRYFNDEAQALEFIRLNKPGFLLGSLGFYLKHSQALGLTMTNQAVIKGPTKSQYYIVAKKGTLAAIVQLEGKTLAGVHLEEPEFVERIVLDRALVFGKQVTINPMRSLRALKRLDQGQVDAVILDQKEYDSLGSLPMGAAVEMIFVSKPIENGGFMAIRKNASPADIQSFTQAAQDFCSFKDSGEICTDFDIQSFKPVTDGLFATVHNQYKGN